MIETRFAIESGWAVLIHDLGIDSVELLRKSGIPEDIFNRKNASVNISEYFQLWNTMYELTDDPNLPLKLATSLSTEAFHPAFFAALCSPNLNIGMQRISQFKRLVGPLVYNVEVKKDYTTITVDCLDHDHPIPDSLNAMEGVFKVNFVRKATRKNIIPLRVITNVPYVKSPAYETFYGCEVEIGTKNSVIFSAEDGVVPFITRNDSMWKVFEPELRKRLSEVTMEDSFAARTRAALLELLPSGLSSVEAVSEKLAVSKRTLQRRLKSEGTNYQEELNATREKLAKHYLANSELSGAQISYLLGFDDPNSFFRAFHSWTGQTPKEIRQRNFA